MNQNQTTFSSIVDLVKRIRSKLSNQDDQRTAIVAQWRGDHSIVINWQVSEGRLQFSSSQTVNVQFESSKLLDDFDDSHWQFDEWTKQSFKTNCFFLLCGGHLVRISVS